MRLSFFKNIRQILLILLLSELWKMNWSILGLFRISTKIIKLTIDAKTLAISNYIFVNILKYMWTFLWNLLKCVKVYSRLILFKLFGL